MNITGITACTNCGSCLNTCPEKAIYTDGSELFYRIRVDADRCTDCGACLKACPVASPMDPVSPLAVYCAQNNDASIRAKSSSGGVFGALSDHVIQMGGAVFGAVFGPGFDEVVFESSDSAGPDALRRSKYVESLTGDSFLRIREQLKAGRWVLFCGAPCQAAGLRAFLKKPYDRLIICDFICGGMPSHRLFREYIGRFKSKGKTVASVNFRPKVFGWSRHFIRVGFAEGGEYVRSFENDPYFSAFLRGKCSVRENCMDCPFARSHASDLTLGDFWAWKQYDGIENDETGLSLVIVNTQKGSELIAAPGIGLDLKALPMEAAESVLKKPEYSEQMRYRREAFLKETERNGLFISAKKYTQYRGVKRIRQSLKVFGLRIAHTGGHR